MWQEAQYESKSATCLSFLLGVHPMKRVIPITKNDLMNTFESIRATKNELDKFQLLMKRYFWPYFTSLLIK